MNPRIRNRSTLLALIPVAAWLAAISCAAMGAEPSANPTSMSFAPGGTVRMKLGEGDMEVVGVAEERITVSWRSKSPRGERQVSVNLQRSEAKEATLSVDGPGDRVHYRIEVPRRSNLTIEMNAGELQVSGVAGNLDVEMLAGEMDLRVADPSRYRNVRASVVAGEITARPWQVDVSGVGRSLKATGEGEYDLRAKLLAGQVTIRSD